MDDRELATLMLRLEGAFPGAWTDERQAVWEDHLDGLDFDVANDAMRRMEREAEYVTVAAFTKALEAEQAARARDFFSTGIGALPAVEVDPETGEVLTPSERARLGMTDRERHAAKQLTRLYALQSATQAATNKTEHNHRYGPEKCPVCKAHDRDDTGRHLPGNQCGRCIELARAALDEIGIPS